MSEQWTKESPIEPGYYWVMDVPDDEELRVVQIYLSMAGLMVENEECDLHVSPPDELDVHAWWPTPLVSPPQQPKT
jgi:hypothetical protein